jgi:uncharacterized membrane protein YfcA
MPHLAWWQWTLGTIAAFMIGVAKTGAPGVGTMMVPLMVLTAGDARQAAAWTLPVLSTADIFALWYWHQHADARRLFSLVPWVLAGMIGGAAALSLSEPVIRRIVAVIIVSMLAILLWRRWSAAPKVTSGGAFYGVVTGFASTVANAAGPVMNLYFLSRGLPKDRFIATGVWFFFVVNLAKAPIYAWYHLYSRPGLTFDALEVPVVLVGAVAGRWLVQRMPQKTFETLIIALTAVSCLLLFN